ncbi:MAG: CDP-diacylglycerol--glycerol-3-phosphate 3-phosphatidyltransferase [Propionibacteriaceae bacterium]|jgi:CDP-diacylglycerol--glycerol-3-phosphate 3-phosphatidyltransferase|nr:CDP-diacylglycerol--glycerol-3-phosphate 3-phosphatidyltransferase [Propionibacteriaceae bacterium]
MTTSNDTRVPANLPNALTTVRLLLVPVFGWMLLAHASSVSWRWIATAVFVVALVTDAVDGRVARKYNLVTDFGKLWDPIADKMITGMAFVGLSIIGELPWWVTIVVLVREWGITVLRFAIIKWGVMAANRGGKAKTLLQSWVLGIWVAPFHLYFRDGQPLGAWQDFTPLWLMWPKLVLMGATVLITVLTGLDYLREAKRLHDRYLARTADPAQDD